MKSIQLTVIQPFLQCLLLGLLSISTPTVNGSEAPAVVIRATPDGGLQPRLLRADDGSIHLIYFRTRLARPDAREGNLFHRRWNEKRRDFGPPIRINSEGLSLQTVSIERASAAVDGSGRIHVVWHKLGDEQYYYTRSDPEVTAFEHQRSMVNQYGEGIDAGADIAALGESVALVWGAGDLSREYERTVYARLSPDGGASWSDELPVGDSGKGACACCSPAAEFADADTLLLAYRSAVEGVGRHTQILELSGVTDGITAGAYAKVFEQQQWEASFCPLSTNDFLRSDDGVALVFETRNRIMFSHAPFDSPPRAVREPFTETRQKNPTLARREDGVTLIAWGEAISHSRGGRLNMAMFDSSGEPTGPVYQAETSIARYSFPAAVVLPSGQFLVLY